MKSLSLAFYKGKGNFYDLLIRTWTNSKYSHLELVIDGICYSSSPRDNGVRRKVIPLDSGNWDILEISDDYLVKQKALEFFDEHKGAKYDTLGAVKIAIRFLPNRKEKFFCSEFCADALGLKQPRKFTPESLYQYFKEKQNV